MAALPPPPIGSGACDAIAVVERPAASPWPRPADDAGAALPHRRFGLARHLVRIRCAQGGAPLRCDGPRPVAERAGLGAEFGMARGAGDVRTAGRGGLSTG